MKKMGNMEMANAPKSAAKGNLVGKQSKLDMNKNGKLDAEDFKMLKK
jgi:hypothetical protein